MSSMFSKNGRQLSSEETPLLPQNRDHIKQPEVVTKHQVALDKKLHTYILVRALLDGSLPSTAQSIILLQKLLASDVLERNNQNLTTDGRKFVDLSRKLVSDLIEILGSKNGEDQIQNFLWTMKKARLDVDFQGLSNVVVDTNAANAKAAYNSLTTISSLLMNNSNFNKLFGDITAVFRTVLASSASTAAKYTGKVAEEIGPSEARLDEVAKSADATDTDVREEILDVLGEVQTTLAEGARETAQDAVETLKETATPERRKAMKQRVRDTVISLRRNADYNTSVSTVSILLKNYLMAYTNAVEEAAEEIADDLKPNKALNRAGRILWSFVTSFGEAEQWDKLQERVNILLEHKNNDPEFENIVSVAVDSLHRLMTDPDFLFSDETHDEFSALQEKFKDMGGTQELKQDLDNVLIQLQRVYVSVRDDKEVTNLKTTSYRMASLVFPSDDRSVNQALIADISHVLVPLMLQALQYIPIPRLTLVSPDVDVLLESLILEPGKTINRSSFFPYNFGIVTTNEVNLFKGRTRTSTVMASTARVKIEGLSLKAEGIGYILKLHKNWFLRLKDSGIASFAIDEKGMDIFLNLEFTKSSIDEMVILKGVEVKIHKLNYTLSRSKFSILAWLFKPLLKPILKKLIENSIASALEDSLRMLNTEMVFLRERLRAVQVANPDDMFTFIKAIMARWTPPETDVDIRLDWRGHRADGRAEAPFDGEYAPGSLATLLESEGVHAADRVDEGDLEGWKSECFEI